MKTVQVVNNEIKSLNGALVQVSIDGVPQEIINVEVSDELYALILADRESYNPDSDMPYIPKYVYSNGEIIEDPQYEQKKAQQQEDKFDREFFNTSLGYVRRAVTMKNGDKKDFLSDILPLLKVGVPILTYDRQLNQSKVIVTEQFISNCENQVMIDFYGVNQ